MVLIKRRQAAVVFCCILGLAERSAAQRVVPSKFVAHSIDTGQYAVARSSSDSRALSGSPLIIQVPLVRSVESDRGAHAGYGALVGAVIGGTVGLLMDRADHTGEGFTAPVMIGGGALLGAAVGALVGLVLPGYHDPAT